MGLTRAVLLFLPVIAGARCGTSPNRNATPDAPERRLADSGVGTDAGTEARADAGTGTGAGSGADGGSAGDAGAITDRRVMAYYYPWYGRPGEPPWADRTGADHPLVGSYDSEDPRLIDYHLELAREIGVDAFLVSWGGRGDPAAPGTDRTNRIFRELLRQIDAVPYHRDFKVAALYEGPAMGLSEQDIVADIQYLLREYAPRNGFLRHRGKPVVLAYFAHATETEKWRRILGDAGGPALYIASADDWRGLHREPLSVFRDAFSTTHRGFELLAPYADMYYSDADLEANYARLTEANLGTGRPRLVAIMGGESPVDKTVGGVRYQIDRSNCRYMRRRYAMARHGDIDADWLTITSWNEWYEGRQIEPSREFEFEGANCTREMAFDFKGRAIVPLDGAALGATCDGRTITIGNNGRQNLYAVGAIMRGTPENVAYLLRPNETVLVNRAACPDEVTGYLVDNTKLRTAVR